MARYVVENGMRVQIPDDPPDDYLRKIAPEGLGNDMVHYEGSGGNLIPVHSAKDVPDGAKIIRVPEISKGSRRRVDSEIDLLKRHIHGRGREVKAGRKTIDGKTYRAVIVNNFPLNKDKYKHFKTNVLFMLPPDYPELPALGCYMNFPPEERGERDHHATLRAHYGAPELQGEGWYWYCVGLGRQFASSGYSGKAVADVWHPGPTPESGHNLITIYAMAHYGINTP